MNQQLLLTINGWAGKNNVLDKFMIFCAKDLIYIVFLVAAACMLWLLYKRQVRTVVYFCITLVVSFGLLELAAHVYSDHRPFTDHHLTQLIAHAAGKSFPSDHTTATTAIAMGLLLFTRFKAVGAATLAGAFLIGFARIFVGVHYPVDILGGLLTGALGGAITYFGVKLYEHRPPVEEEVSERHHPISGPSGH